jgi:hypothetical protein
MVYIEEGETAVCPVCSSPLLESTRTVEDEDAQPAEETAS